MGKRRTWFSQIPYCVKNIVLSKQEQISLKKLFTYSLYVSFCLTCLFALLAFGDKVHWFLELYVHFRLQYALAFCILGILFFGLKKRKLAVLNLALAIVLFFQLLPNQKTGFQQVGSETSATALDVLSINLLSSNTKFEEVNTLVESLDPDMLVLIEFTSFWEEHIDLEQYPFHIHSIREDYFGIGFYSKIPLDTKQIIDFTDSRFPFVHAAVRVNDKVVHILGAHFENPVGSKASKVRNFQMEETARFLNRIKDPKLLIGDFNCTPYSQAFKSLLDKADLYDSRSKWTIGASWPTFFFPLMIPIDHALISDELYVIDRKLLDTGGSDHKALFVSVGLN